MHPYEHKTRRKEISFSIRIRERENATIKYDNPDEISSCLDFFLCPATPFPHPSYYPRTTSSRYHLHVIHIYLWMKYYLGRSLSFFHPTSPIPTSYWIQRSVTPYYTHAAGYRTSVTTPIFYNTNVSVFGRFPRFRPELQGSLPSNPFFTGRRIDLSVWRVRESL